MVLQGSTLAKEKTCETTASNFAKHGHACMAMQKKHGWQVTYSKSFFHYVGLSLFQVGYFKSFVSLYWF